MKRDETVRGRVTPETKRRVKRMARKTPGGESGVVRTAVERHLDEEREFIREINTGIAAPSPRRKRAAT